MINPTFAQYIGNFQALSHQQLPITKIEAVLPKSSEPPQRKSGRPCALMLSPHPDDECLMGALALRLSLESNWQIINIAVTLGSNQARKHARLSELAQACAVTGFECLLPAPEAFHNVRIETREKDANAWRKFVDVLSEIFRNYKPDVIIFPHAQDRHYTHIGTHLLTLDALAMMPTGFSCRLVQSEYWHPNENPNLMIGLSEKDATTLLAALCCYTGENSRNPFHLRFPPYLSDNVRRGSERLSGEGAKVAAMDFAMLYRLDTWKNGKIYHVSNKRIFAPEQLIVFDNR